MNLILCQKAHALVLEIYKITSLLPKSEQLESLTRFSGDQFQFQQILLKAMGELVSKKKYDSCILQMAL